MKRLLVLISAVLLTACAAKQPQQVFVPPVTTQNVPISASNIPSISYVYEADVTAMSRQQVIEATRLCEDAGLRASPVTARRRITGQTSESIVDINCMPRYK